MREKAFFEPHTSKFVAPNSHPATTFSVGGLLPPATTNAIRPLAKARTAECLRHAGTKCKINRVLCARTRRWDGNASSRSGCNRRFIHLHVRSTGRPVAPKVPQRQIKNALTISPKTQKLHGVNTTASSSGFSTATCLLRGGGEKKAGNESFIAEEASSSGISGTTSH